MDSVKEIDRLKEAYPKESEFKDDAKWKVCVLSYKESYLPMGINMYTQGPCKLSQDQYTITLGASPPSFPRFYLSTDGAWHLTRGCIGFRSPVKGPHHRTRRLCIPVSIHTLSFSPPVTQQREKGAIWIGIGGGGGSNELEERMEASLGDGFYPAALRWELLHRRRRP